MEKNCQTCERKIRMKVDYMCLIEGTIIPRALLSSHGSNCEFHSGTETFEELEQHYHGA
jgi:hypothetical protein